MPREVKKISGEKYPVSSKVETIYMESLCHWNGRLEEEREQILREMQMAFPHADPKQVVQGLQATSEGSDKSVLDYLREHWHFYVPPTTNLAVPKIIWDYAQRYKKHPETNPSKMIEQFILDTAKYDYLGIMVYFGDERRVYSEMFNMNISNDYVGKFFWDTLSHRIGEDYVGWMHTRMTLTEWAWYFEGIKPKIREEVRIRAIEDPDYNQDVYDDHESSE